MKKLRVLVALIGIAFPTASVLADDVSTIVPAVNGTGLDLYRSQASKGDGNLLLSPYSIATALAMAYAGADGDTKKEMQQVLHLPADDEAVAKGFAGLAAQLTRLAESSKKDVARSKKYGGPTTPTEVNVANRLFLQRDYSLRKPFVSLLADRYKAPVESLDFRKDPEKSRRTINQWVEKQTRDKIRDLIPQGNVNGSTRLVLVNAIYLYAAWLKEFSEHATKPAPFKVHGKTPVDVPMMNKEADYGYAKYDGYTAVSLPYSYGSLSFLILLPDAPDGLAKLEKQITAADLAKQVENPSRTINLTLPKFRLAPPTLPLAEALQALGMKSAFDIPAGSANFDRMAPRTPADYLAISQVFHKAYLSLDEKGTEAAAATAVIALPGGIPGPPEKPIVVKVDRPFLFAIQDYSSGTCLFLGRVTDPR